VFLQRLINSAGGGTPVVPVSYGVEVLQYGDENEGAGENEHEGGESDPHTWFDPRNVMIWVDNVERSLAILDPEHSAEYRANATTYRGALEELDAAVVEQASVLPSQRRRLVTDHASFGYFAARFGFEQVATVFPGYSTLSEPSARDVAALEDAIRGLGVPAVFVGVGVNPSLAQRVAEDTGTRLVFLYTGSLSEPGGPASTYLDLMMYDVGAIVEALGE
jgi:ABC-type Zn uptake system ZnuABC Zn-binding protein ZnuA